MRPELQSRAVRQQGVFTRRDAKESGYTERELKTLTGHNGGWVVVRRGVYSQRELWETLDEDGRYLLQTRAVHLSLRHEAALSHTSAAGVHGLPIRPHWRKLQHVTRPGVQGGRTENGVKHHLAGLESTDLVTVAGLVVTSLARTAVDVGREHGFESGVIASDAVLRRGATHQDLDRAIAPMTNWPGITAARSAIEVADEGAENLGESLARILVRELGIGVPETQFEVREGSRWAAADLRVGRHLFEFDGKIKYVGRERGGVADRSAEEVLWDEKRREDWLRSLGWGVSRIIWDDLFGPRRAMARQRLMREYLETERRFSQAS